MPFTADYISDVHLNLWKYKDTQILPIFSTLSPNLVLAGDIGDPDEPSLHRALDIVRHKYKRVLYIPGNHEFYARENGSKKTPASVIDWFQKLDQQWDNFHFFYRRSEVVDGIRILGCTGWSTSPKETEWAHRISQEGKLDIEFLDRGISTSKEKCLIVTHYPCTLRVLQPEFSKKITQYDYAQNLEYLFRYPVDTWLFGHVHQRHRIEVPYSSSMAGGGIVKLRCNPYGYPHEGITSPRTEQIVIDGKV